MIRLNGKLRRRGSARFICHLAVITLYFGFAGCALPAIETGKPLPTNGLKSLVSGQSTPDQVRAALGEPRGFGAARYRPELGRHDVWYYELLQAKGDQIGVSILLVMFKENHYDGYFWFRAKELLKGLPT